MVVGSWLVTPAPALAAESPDCRLSADRPQQGTGSSIFGIGHRSGCVQRRREVIVRIRRDIRFFPDETVAQTRREGIINDDIGVIWDCSTGDGGVFFTEILTNAGGKAQSPRVDLICPLGS
jgi:hypothetical protein